MDTEMLWNLFSFLSQANTILALGDDSFIAELNTLKALLPPYKINYFGGIQEWIEDFQEVSDIHRTRGNFTNAFRLTPSSRRTPESTTCLPSGQPTQATNSPPLQTPHSGTPRTPPLRTASPTAHPPAAGPPPGA